MTLELQSAGMSELLGGTDKQTSPAMRFGRAVNGAKITGEDRKTGCEQEAERENEGP